MMYALRLAAVDETRVAEERLRAKASRVARAKKQAARKRSKSRSGGRWKKEKQQLAERK